MTSIRIFSRLAGPMLVIVAIVHAFPLSTVASSNIAAINPLQPPSTTVSFQDGVSPTINYAGTWDTWLSENEPSTSFGVDSRLRVDGDDPPGSQKDISILLRWDLTSIPKFSPIQSATIMLHFDGQEENRHSDDKYSLFALRRNWSENQATWTNNQTNSFWDQPGALGATDRGILFGSFTPSQGQEKTIVLNPQGINLVQTWVNDPAQNYGLVISSLINTDGADFLSSESPTKTYRPKLTVRYQPRETISPPPTSKTAGSLFKYHGIAQGTAPATLSRSLEILAGNPILLELNTTRTIASWDVTNAYDVTLDVFDTSTNINLTIENSNGATITSFSVNPQQSRYLFRFGMGKPLGMYTVKLTQGKSQAAFKFTTSIDNSPGIGINPSCSSPGNSFTLFIEGLARNTALDIYSHDHDEGLNRIWKYVTSLPAPRVNERGEAQYTLTTQNNDRKDTYLIVTRDQRAEVTFSLPCP